MVAANCTLQVAAGSYEHVLYGFECALSRDAKGAVKGTLSTRYVYEPHAGCISAIAGSGPVLVSGSSDEVIKIYNVAQRVEVGTLMEHQGTITSLAFYGLDNMLSASEDGGIGIWQLPDWDLLKIMKGHKGPVNDLSVHPEGKLALSVGRDKTVRTWNLLTGRSAYVWTRKAEAHLVRWSPCGQYFLIVSGAELELFDMATGKAKHAWREDNRITAAVFLANNRIALGGYGNSIKIVDMFTGEQIMLIKGHSNRIRSLAVCTPFCTDTDAGPEMLVSASSDASIKVWQLPAGDAAQGVELGNDDFAAMVQTHARITCMTLAALPETPAEAAMKKAARAAAAAKDEQKKSAKVAAAAVAAAAAQPQQQQKKKQNKKKADDDEDEAQGERSAKRAKKSRADAKAPAAASADASAAAKPKKKVKIVDKVEIVAAPNAASAAPSKGDAVNPSVSRRSGDGIDGGDDDDDDDGLTQEELKAMRVKAKRERRKLVKKKAKQNQRRNRNRGL
eukprot:m.39152 g.39152  ORF g.39152 m.39152 type:complete len:505 (-) comp5929_c0_seq1:170-1684(-)